MKLLFCEWISLKHTTPPPEAIHFLPGCLRVLVVGVSGSLSGSPSLIDSFPFPLSFSPSHQTFALTIQLIDFLLFSRLFLTRRWQLSWPALNRALLLVARSLARTRWCDTVPSFGSSSQNNLIELITTKPVWQVLAEEKKEKDKHKIFISKCVRGSWSCWSLSSLISFSSNSTNGSRAAASSYARWPKTLATNQLTFFLPNGSIHRNLCFFQLELVCSPPPHSEDNIMIGCTTFASTSAASDRRQ